MTDRIETIKPGTAQVLADHMPDNVLIKNTDSVNAVWVSVAANVSPGNGQLVRPFGFFHWTKPGVRVYACVDTGVVTPVNILLSDTTADPQDPYGVALAVATQQQIATSTLVAQQLTGVGGNPNFDISAYNSITISCSCTFTGGPNVNAQAVYCDSAGNPLYNAADLSSGTKTSKITIPVIAPIIKIMNLDPTNDLSITITGSNRPCQRYEVGGNGNSTEYWTASAAPFVVGTSYALTSQSNVGLSGPVFAVFTIAGTVVKGEFNLVTFAADVGVAGGTPVGIAVADTNEASVLTNQNIRKMMALPRMSYHAWTFTCRTTGGNSSVSVALYPASSG